MAKQQLIIQYFNSPEGEDLDEQLFKELAAVLLNLDKNQQLKQVCRTRKEADQIENRLTDELVKTYNQIKLRKQDPLIQQLNALL